MAYSFNCILLLLLLSFSLSSERDRELMSSAGELALVHHQIRALNAHHTWHTYLGSYHAIALVHRLFHTSSIKRSPKAGPTGARIEFGVGGK